MWMAFDEASQGGGGEEIAMRVAPSAGRLHNGSQLLDVPNDEEQLQQLLVG